jgi:hypothetical protein
MSAYTIWKVYDEITPSLFFISVFDRNIDDRHTDLRTR